MYCTSQFRSPSANSLFLQATRHFRHKIPVEIEENSARLRFSACTGDLHVDGDLLHLTVTAQDHWLMVEICEVLEKHLLRFAYREAPAQLQWTYHKEASA